VSTCPTTSLADKIDVSGSQGPAHAQFAGALAHRVGQRAYTPSADSVSADSVSATAANVPSSTAYERERASAAAISGALKSRYLRTG